MKAVLTVIGRDTIGIIAKVSGYLADNKINILDILSFTPENVKNGVAEQVKKLIEEVK